MSFPISFYLLYLLFLSPLSSSLVIRPSSPAIFLVFSLFLIHDFSFFMYVFRHLNLSSLLSSSLLSSSLVISHSSLSIFFTFSLFLIHIFFLYVSFTISIHLLSSSPLSSLSVILPSSPSIFFTCNSPLFLFSPAKAERGAVERVSR